MTLTLNSHISLLTQLLTFRSKAAIVSKHPLVSHFPLEKPKLQNLTCREIGQGQPSVII